MSPGSQWRTWTSKVGWGGGGAIITQVTCVHSWLYMSLVAELKRMRAAVSGGQDWSKELARMQQYTSQLEKQLRFYLSHGSGEPPVGGTWPVYAHI